MKTSGVAGALRMLRVLVVVVGVAASALVMTYEVPILFSHLGEDD